MLKKYHSIADKIPQFDGGADEKDGGQQQNVENPTQWFYLDLEGKLQVVLISLIATK